MSPSIGVIPSGREMNAELSGQERPFPDGPSGIHILAARQIVSQRGAERFLQSRAQPACDLRSARPRPFPRSN